MVAICSLCVGIVFVCSADAFLMESSTTLSKHFFQKFSAVVITCFISYPIYLTFYTQMDTVYMIPKPKM